MISAAMESNSEKLKKLAKKLKKEPDSEASISLQIEQKSSAIAEKRIISEGFKKIIEDAIDYCGNKPLKEKTLRDLIIIKGRDYGIETREATIRKIINDEELKPLALLPSAFRHMMLQRGFSEAKIIYILRDALGSYFTHRMLERKIGIELNDSTANLAYASMNYPLIPSDSDHAFYNIITDFIEEKTNCKFEKEYLKNEQLRIGTNKFVQDLKQLKIIETTKDQKIKGGQKLVFVDTGFAGTMPIFAESAIKTVLKVENGIQLGTRKDDYNLDIWLRPYLLECNTENKRIKRYTDYSSIVSNLESYFGDSNPYSFNQYAENPLNKQGLPQFNLETSEARLENNVATFYYGLFELGNIINLQV